MGSFTYSSQLGAKYFLRKIFHFGATFIKKDRKVSTEMKKNLHIEKVIEENCLSTDGYSDDRLIAKFHQTILLHELNVLVHPAKVLNVFYSLWQLDFYMLEVTKDNRGPL